MKPEDLDALKAAAEPLIKYLNDHHHPHTTVIVTPISAEVLEGVLTHRTVEFVKD